MYIKFLLKKYYLSVKNYFSLNKKSPQFAPDWYNYKWSRLKKIITKYNVSVLIETGTYYGLTVERIKNKVNKIYSVEIDDKLYNANNRYFKNYSNVNIIHGDSAYVLPVILDQLKNENKGEALLFWLDGHCSEKETGQGAYYSPLIFELELIKKYYSDFHSIVVIDDLRLFDGENYPSLEELKEVFGNDIFEFHEDSDACVFVDRRLFSSHKR